MESDGEGKAPNLCRYSNKTEEENPQIKTRKE
jgi:hypothetical protein